MVPFVLRERIAPTRFAAAYRVNKSLRYVQWHFDLQPMANRLPARDYAGCPEETIVRAKRALSVTAQLVRNGARDPVGAPRRNQGERVKR
jgi:hypothetical protein